MMMASARDLSKFQVCPMIVCVCNNISDREIAQAVELGATSMDALRSDLGVATCCGNCADCARELLKECLADGKTGTEVATVTQRRLPQSLAAAA